MDKNSTEKLRQERKPSPAYSPQTPEQLLRKGYLQQMVTKANKIKRIDDYIKNSIAPEWATYYHVQNLNGNTLVISALNSSVAHKLRLCSLDWVYSLRQAHWPQISKIEIRVSHHEDNGARKFRMPQEAGSGKGIPQHLQDEWDRLRKSL